MTIHHNEEWVQIATIDECNKIKFTNEFLVLFGDYLWEAKKICRSLPRVV